MFIYFAVFASMLHAIRNFYYSVLVCMHRTTLLWRFAGNLQAKWRYCGINNWRIQRTYYLTNAYTLNCCFLHISLHLNCLTQLFCREYTLRMSIITVFLETGYSIHQKKLTPKRKQGFFVSMVFFEINVSLLSILRWNDPIWFLQNQYYSVMPFPLFLIYPE